MRHFIVVMLTVAIAASSTTVSSQTSEANDFAHRVVYAPVLEHRFDVEVEGLHAQGCRKYRWYFKVCGSRLDCPPARRLRDGC